MAARHALDEAVQRKTSKVVGHGPWRVRVRVSILELRNVIAKLPMSKARGRAA